MAARACAICAQPIVAPTAMVAVPGCTVLRVGVCGNCHGAGRTPDPDMVRLSIASGIAAALGVPAGTVVDAFAASNGSWGGLARRLGVRRREVDDALALAVGSVRHASVAMLPGSRG